MKAIRYEMPRFTPESVLNSTAFCTNQLQMLFATSLMTMGAIPLLGQENTAVLLVIRLLCVQKTAEKDNGRGFSIKVR